MRLLLCGSTATSRCTENLPPTSIEDVVIQAVVDSLVAGLLWFQILDGNPAIIWSTVATRLYLK